MNLLGALSIFDTISDFMKEAARVVTWEYLLYGGVGLAVVILFLVFIRTRFTYEVRLLKNVNKLNKHFAKNPYINDDNIIEINNKFKRVPKTFRSAWQQFMLNRDKLPSEYMNTVTCVDQPLKSSAHKNSAAVANILTFTVALLTAFVGIAINYTFPVGDLFEGFFKVALAPTIIIILGQLFVALLRARNTAITADLYNNFHTFESYINKACTTMPPYIDYEVLFTKKEIKDGIPVLQEYLEKRALMEQKEKEEAELMGGNLEKFNFDDLGVENALLLERAMTESEKYFNLKHKLSEQINSKEVEIYNFQKNFDEVTKDFERKSQAVKESLKQLNEQLNATTVNIEANYIKKRYKEEQQKLQQMEKDYEIASIRFNKQQNDQQNEIDALKAEIEHRRAEVEQSMMDEGRAYANKIYGQINSAVVDQNKPILEEKEQKVKEMEEKLEAATKKFEDVQIELNNTQTMLNTVTSELQSKQAEIAGIKNLREYLTSPEFKDRVTEGGKIARAQSSTEVEMLRRKAQDAEEQLRIANARSKALEEQEAQLESKLKELQESEKKLAAENKDLEKSRLEAETKRNNELAEVNKKIMEENDALKANQKDLEKRVNETIEIAKPAQKRATLNDLVNHAKAIEKKNKK